MKLTDAGLEQASVKPVYTLRDSLQLKHASTVELHAAMISFCSVRRAAQRGSSSQLR